MQKQTQPSNGNIPQPFADVAEVVYEKVQEGMEKVASSTESLVRKNPLVSLGIAAGAGIAIGAIGVQLFSPKPKSLLDRLGWVALAGTAIKGVAKLF